MLSRFHLLAMAALAALCMVIAPAAHAQVQITQLSDVSFGNITALDVDQVRSQSVCAFSGLLGGRYSVTATGSGTGNAFTLSNGSAALPYEVQWSGTAGRTSGTNLAAGAPLSGQTMALSCPLLQATNASLIVVLRGTALTSAQAGNYSGVLTLILAAN